MNDLIRWGFVKMIKKSTNQYSSNIIALSTALSKNDKSLDKALIKHMSKQSESTCQSTGESKCSIDKQETINNKPITKTCETSSHTILKNYFLEFFKKRNDTPFFNWSGKDAMALNQLIKKMTKLHEEKKLDISPPAIENSIKIMINQITDTWILDHISIPILNSKFSEIISNIKAQKNGIKSANSKTTNQSGVSDDYKRDVANRILGNKVHEQVP